ncbi:MAG: CBS domain-containing protein [Candidatus Uhrbacteria bacterium]
MIIRDVYHPRVETVLESQSIEAVLKHMVRHSFNGFVVINDHKKAVGVISIQDIAAAVVPHQFQDNVSMASAMYRKGFFHQECIRVKHLKAKDVMRTDYISVDLKTSIMAVASDFLKNDLYIVPVIEKGKLVGIVTRTEIKKALVEAMGKSEASYE